jgi:hypothetical protein
MFTTSDLSASVPPRRQELRRAIGVTATAFAVAMGLVWAVDAGARLMGPALIVVGAVGGGYALRAWWRHLDQRAFPAEVALVALGWGLLAASYAGLQFLAFSFLGGAYRIDVDYRTLIAPEFTAAWRNDSLRAATTLEATEAAIRALDGSELPSVAVGTSYRLTGGATAKIVERCLTPAGCEWRLEVAPGGGDRPIDVGINGPDEGARGIPGHELLADLKHSANGLRREVAAYGRRLTDPASHVEPRVVDFWYDTIVAFAGRESGVFVAVGALPRAFRVIADLASFILFGIVVARASTATSVDRRRR